MTTEYDFQEYNMFRVAVYGNPAALKAAFQAPRQGLGLQRPEDYLA